jgi:predicted ester cyclase
MPDPRHRHLIEQFMRATTTDDYDIFDKIMTEDYRQIDSQLPDGREAIKEFFRRSADAFSDKRAELVYLVSDGDRMAVRMKLRGVHTGHFFSLAPTGREIEIDGADFFWVRDGRLSAHFGVSNPLHYLYQMGVVQPGWPFSGAPMPE